MAKKIRTKNVISVELENRIVMDEVNQFYKWQYLWFLIIAVGLPVAALLYYLLA